MLILALIVRLATFLAPPPQEPVEPARLLPPVPQAPGKLAPGLISQMTPRDRAILATRQGIRAEINKRTAPDSLYMKENPGANPYFNREILNRAIFETLAISHGDKGLLMELIAEFKAYEYQWINPRLARADLDWIVREKSKWLDSAINRLSAGRAASGAEVMLKAEPIPSPFFITTGTGIHPAFKDLSSTELAALREEAQFLRGNKSGFELSARYVADALRVGLDSPAEAELSTRFILGKTLDSRFFYARLWQSVFLNMETFQGDRALLADALSLLAEDVPDVTNVRDSILAALGTIKRERVKWFDEVVLPNVWKFEHNEPLVGGGLPTPSSQMAPAVTVELPRVAWILAQPGPENIPRRRYSNHSQLKSMNDVIRSVP